jgi:hypothetical protein
LIKSVKNTIQLILQARKLALENPLLAFKADYAYLNLQHPQTTMRIQLTKLTEYPLS